MSKAASKARDQGKFSMPTVRIPLGVHRAAKRVRTPGPELFEFRRGGADEGRRQAPAAGNSGLIR